jgi:hypothetical protein
LICAWRELKSCAVAEVNAPRSSDKREVQESLHIQRHNVSHVFIVDTSAIGLFKRLKRRNTRRQDSVDMGHSLRVVIPRFSDVHHAEQGRRFELLGLVNTKLAIGLLKSSEISD